MHSFNFGNDGSTEPALFSIDIPYDLQNLNLELRNDIPSEPYELHLDSAGRMDPINSNYTLYEIGGPKPTSLSQTNLNWEGFLAEAPLVESPEQEFGQEELFALFMQSEFSDQSDGVLCVSPSDLCIQSTANAVRTSPTFSGPTYSSPSEFEITSPTFTSGSSFDALDDDEVSIPSLTDSFFNPHIDPYPSPPSTTGNVQESNLVSSSAVNPDDISEEDSVRLRDLTQRLIDNGYSTKSAYLPALLRNVRIATVKQFQARLSSHSKKSQDTEDNENAAKYRLKNDHFTPFFEPHKVIRDRRTTNIHTCCFCLHALGNRTQIIQHIKGRHIGYLPHWCDLCERRFARPADLNKHIEDKHSDKSCPCKECGRIYSNSRNLRRHEKKCSAKSERKKLSIARRTRGGY